MRRPPQPVKIFGMGVSKARLLGAALGASVPQICTSTGHVLCAHTLRTSARIRLTASTSEADCAFLRGVLAHNPHLDDEQIEEALQASKGRVRPRKSLNGDASALLAQMVHELKANGDM